MSIHVACCTTHHMRNSRKKSRLIHVKESCHTYAWVMSHVCRSHVTLRGVLYDTRTCTIQRRSHDLHIRKSHVTHMNESCRTYERVMSLHVACCTTHTRITHGKVTTHSCERVMSQIWMVHVTRMKESCQSMWRAARHIHVSAWWKESRLTHMDQTVDFIDKYMCPSIYVSMTVSATHCNTLQHTATHCHTLQHNATMQIWMTKIGPESTNVLHATRICLGARVAACCSVLQRIAACGSVLHATCICLGACVAACFSVLQCVAVCCSVLVCAVCDTDLFCCSVLQRVAACCSVLQCVAVCCMQHWSV